MCFLRLSEYYDDNCDHNLTPEYSYQDPVNVMSPYWLNDTCDPFASQDASCVLGNMPLYAINVQDAKSVKIGLEFAQQKNIRLVVKNTGHDYIGRSNGKGSLSLWTHNLKTLQIIDYKSSAYTGKALKAGAGVQFFEANQFAADNGVRVVGGYCPSVGMVGGYIQGGGHGPLASSHGLAADNTLEFEVVTVDGRHTVASPTKNSDLYWALSGGGAGTYAIVLSVTVKAHQDGPTAGATLVFENTNEDTYFAGIGAFHQWLRNANKVPGFGSSWGFNNQAFQLNVATLTNGTQTDIENVLAPLLTSLKALNITVLQYAAKSYENYHAQYQAYTFPPEIYATNNSLGGRLIPGTLIDNNLPGLIETYKTVVKDSSFFNRVSGISVNVTHARVGNTAASNAVLPAWRDALITLNFGVGFPADANAAELQAAQAKVNQWQVLFRNLTPGGGAYMNEATFDAPTWKEDYFGSNYNRLLKIKQKYDPRYVLWQHTSVGSDSYWQLDGRGALCRVKSY